MKNGLHQKRRIEIEILKEIRVHPGSGRISLARKLRIAPSTISDYTRRLIRKNLLVEDCQKAMAEAGRQQATLHLNPEGGQFIGVDLETDVMAVAMDFADRPLRWVHKDLARDDSAPAVIGKIEEAIVEILPADLSKLLAVGVGVPGIVNPAKGTAVYYKQISNWENIELTGPLARKFGVPVYLENNVHSMTLAELSFGQGRGLSDWLCVSIRSRSVGAGIVVGGELKRGVNHQADEIGRWLCPGTDREAARFFANTYPTTKGMELQEATSIQAILGALERARQSGQKSLLFVKDKPLVFTDVVRAAWQRDRLTLQVIEVVADILGWVVAELTLALNPSRVVLTGSLTLLDEILLLPLRRRAGDILGVRGSDLLPIVNSTMGDYSGASGAAALALHQWNSG